MGYSSSIFLRFFVRQVLSSKESLRPKCRDHQNASKTSPFGRGRTSWPDTRQTRYVLRPTPSSSRTEPFVASLVFPADDGRERTWEWVATASGRQGSAEEVRPEVHSDRSTADGCSASIDMGGVSSGSGAAAANTTTPPTEASLCTTFPCPPPGTNMVKGCCRQCCYLSSELVVVTSSETRRLRGEPHA